MITIGAVLLAVSYVVLLLGNTRTKVEDGVAVRIVNIKGILFGLFLLFVGFVSFFLGLLLRLGDFVWTLIK